MSSTIERTDVSHGSSTSPAAAPRKAPRKNGGFGWLIGLILLLVLAAAGVYAAPRVLESFSADTSTKMLTYEAARGELLITVTEEGNVESASNIDIKCQVAGGSSILWIVEDGSLIKKGDKLVELDAAALEEQISTQRIAYEKALSTKIQSEKTYEVAKISVTEYLEGTFKIELQAAEAAITIALENLRSAENALEFSEKLFRKGYVSSLELEGQKFGVERSNIELESAKTAKEVLEKFSKVKMLEDLQSQRDNAEAQMKSDAAAYDLEKVRLERLEKQMANCTITANADGMVVYANERGGRFGQSEATVEEGAAVRERQTILRLPDLSQMQVKVNVHESKIDQIRPGLRARMQILDRELRGTVTSVANQPEPSSFFTGNVKEYATIVRIGGQPETLRPGMTAEVEILVAQLEDVVTLPVAAVVEQRGKFYCWVETPEGPERRPLVLGLSDDQFIEIKDGVLEGEQVLLNPRAVVREARESQDGSGEDVNVTEKFGDESSAPPMPAPGAEGGRRPGGREGDGPGGPGSADGGPGGRGGGGRGGSGGGGNRGGGRGGMNLKQLDKDGDGKVSKEEAPEQMSDFFDRIDSNADGFIEQSEIDEMRRQFQQGGGGGGRPGGPGGD